MCLICFRDAEPSISLFKILSGPYAPSVVLMCGYRLSAGVFQLTGVCRAEAAVATTQLLQEHREKVLAAMALTDLPAQSVTGPHGVGAADALAGMHTGLRRASWAHDM